MKHTRIIVTHYGGPEALQVLEEECPTPKAGEVRVNVRAAGVSLPDLMMREGIHPETPRLPFTPGWDLVGTVDRLGEGVSGIEPGQLVAALPISGAYAEFVCLLWDGRAVEKVLEMPSIFIGSVDQIVDEMQARRERYGISYYVVSNRSLQAVAPIVVRVAGAWRRGAPRFAAQVRSANEGVVGTELLFACAIAGLVSQGTQNVVRAGMASWMYGGPLRATAIHRGAMAALRDVSGIDATPSSGRRCSLGAVTGTAFRPRRTSRIRRGDHGEDRGPGRVF